MMRTNYAGELRLSDEGSEVVLCGWIAHRRDHGGVVFVDVRDVEGFAQVVIDPTAAGCEIAHELRSEYVVRIEGVVRRRPEGTSNPDMPTGEIEVGAKVVTILSEAEPPPFPLDDRADVDEALRLRYRYLDLRRGRFARNLKLRAKLVAAVRSSMDAQRFTEVETPSLTRSTPEGARDFLVPSRLQRGSFYALPQSPQLFKQLLMVAGLDRYYQVARCWRDEDLRADRQPEFTQLDLEASFVDAEDVMAIVEQTVRAGIEAIVGATPAAFPRMTWHEAMARYGSDKPDLRFGMELVDCTSCFVTSEFKVFAAKHVVGMRVEGQGAVPRSQLDSWTDAAKRHGAGGLVWMRVVEGERGEGGGGGTGGAGDGTTVESPVAKFLSGDELTALITRVDAKVGDLLLLTADAEPIRAQAPLGALRSEIGKPQRLDDAQPPLVDELSLCWVTDFPLFEGMDDNGRAISAHHPFTMPHADDLELLQSEPLKVRSLAYDLVLNGVELGSGSVRIHDRKLQEQIFALLGIGQEQAQERFGFLLDAFRYGAPPHAGFAFGIDRLAMILAGENSLRDVIAFPKTQSGGDPLTGAPSPVDTAQLADLGLVSKPRLTSGASDRQKEAT